MSFNTYSKKSKTYGGTHPVWRDVKGKITSGGVIPADRLVAGTIIPAGTPVYIAKAGSEVKLLEFYKVVSADASAKTVTIVAAPGLPAPVKDNVVMKVPAGMETTGQSQKITAVSKASDGKTIVLTFGTALSCAKDDYLSLAAGADASATAAMLVTDCNALTENDVYIEEGTYAATCAGVFNGTIWADRISPIPPCVKAKLPQIFFQEGI